VTLKSRFAAVLAVAGLLVGLTTPAANAAVVQVAATVETAPMHGTGDAADDAAIWIHPTDPSKSTIIGTDKSTDGHGLVVYDLTGKELFYYPVGRMNNVDVRYNFPLGTSRVGLVGVTNRVRSLDFYKVNESDRSLTKVGSFAPGTDITTPRGFALYHSPDTGKYYAYVTDSAKVEQWELDGSTGSVTGKLVRKWTISGPATEGLVADDELKRIYVAQEDIGGIWRIGAEPGNPTTGTRVVSTTENGGDIVQDIKGISIYYGSGGAGYLLAASQGSNRFHVYARDDNRPLGAFAIPTANGIDAVTGTDGIDVTNFGVGGPFPQGFFITQDHVNDTGNQSFKLVPWQNIAAAYAPALLVDAAYDPRKIGAGTPAPQPPDTTITGNPTNPTSSTSAQFSFTSTSTSATFGCSLDSAAFTTCVSPASYSGLSAGAHTFQVGASDQNGVDPTPASYTWTVGTTPPPGDTTPPETTITSGPPATSTSTSASFAFTSSEANSTFQCSLDGATRAACTSPHAYTGLSIGSHTFNVWATDAAGNTDASAATQTWSISTGGTGGASIVRESVSQATNTATSTTLTIPKPANVAQGDLLVSCVALNGGSIAAAGVPAGWTGLAAVTAIANPKVYGYYKVATASEPASYSWTTTSTTSGGGIARYSGASGLDTAATSASGAAASSGTVPAVTSTTANAMLVGCMSVNSSSVTLTSPAGMAQAVETGARRFEIADGIQAVAGPSGAKTWNFSAAREWAGWLVALRPKTP
jgi:myo-inositol-hexaphosphate 3-phosphohydrolase